MVKKAKVLIRNIKDYWVSINPNLRFVFLLLAVALVYDYPSILFKRPQSVHHWRQSDCASMSLNYYQTGMCFFKPQTHNLTSDNNTTGYVATSEIPIGYYFVAILYKVFGPHDFIYRVVNTLIFLLGLFYLFKICCLLFNDFFWSSVVTLFFFTSPVLVYYGNNYLTDTSALSFALIAWYFFFKFYFFKKQKWFYLFVFFFFLAGAYKITALLSFVVIGFIFITEFFGIFKFKKEGKIFSKPLVSLISILIVLVVIGSWVFFAKNYNGIHGTGYFSTGIFPIWDLDNSQIQQVIKYMNELWLDQYFNIFALYFLAGAFLFTIFNIKKCNFLLMTSSILLLFETVIYAVLWFQTFKDHDYYTINLFIFLIFILLNFIWMIKSIFLKVFFSPIVKALFLCFLLFNVVYAQKQMKARYYGWWNEHPEYKDYDSITPYLRSKGIHALDTVICLPDQSHFTLYLMNQRGWTECYGNNHDSASIQASIKHGAKYLIVNGNETLGRKYLQHFLSHPIGQYGNIHIYKLQKKMPCEPQKLSKKVELLFCGAERISEDKKYYLEESSDKVFEQPETQSDEKSFEGKYSAKLTQRHPFAMTVRFDQIEKGDHFVAEVIRYSSNGKGMLVASANNISEFYINSPTRKVKMTNGWEKLTLDFYINFTPRDRQIAFYLWNPDATPVYFDNLKIVRE
jgi:hypothetical protein